jgi:hypothetical protein
MLPSPIISVSINGEDFALGQSGKRVRGLSQLDTLASDGYTIPGAIIEDPGHKNALALVLSHRLFG